MSKKEEIIELKNEICDLEVDIEFLKQDIEIMEIYLRQHAKILRDLTKEVL